MAKRKHSGNPEHQQPGGNLEGRPDGARDLQGGSPEGGADQGGDPASAKGRPKKAKTDAEYDPTEPAEVCEAFERWLKRELSLEDVADAFNNRLAKKEESGEKVGGAKYNWPKALERFQELRALGVIEIHAPLHKLSDDLIKQWDWARYYVLDIRTDQYFFRWAPYFFLRELDEVLTERRRLRKKESSEAGAGVPRDDVLRIAIVGGSTTGRLIESLCSQSWDLDVFRPENAPRKICVYALNVSQPESFEKLCGNANVLVWQLASKLKKVFENASQDVCVEAYGLSTALLQTRTESQRSDVQAPTLDVVRYTDPARLRESIEAAGTEKQKEGVLADLLAREKEIGKLESELDVIITGVGSLEASLFREYLDANDIDVRHAGGHSPVGDVAYWPVDLDGKEAYLVRRSGEERMVFYCAADLEVFRNLASANRRDKKVIIIARGREKAEPLMAAINGHLGNVIIIDPPLADALDGWFSRRRRP